MRVIIDRVGFPVLQLDDNGLAVALWPVTKVQAEHWLAEPDGPGNTWYEEVLAVNRRASWRRFTPAERERLLLTGVKPEEARRYARWLGEAFDVPSVDQWRKVDAALHRQRLTAKQVEFLRGQALHAAARALLDQLLEQVRPSCWGDLMLLSGGVFEWVSTPSGFAGLGGRTRLEFFRSLFNPQADEPVTPFADRSPYFGFRPVQRAPANQPVVAPAPARASANRNKGGRP